MSEHAQQCGRVHSTKGSRELFLGHFLFLPSLPLCRDTPTPLLCIYTLPHHSTHFTAPPNSITGHLCTAIHRYTPRLHLHLHCTTKTYFPHILFPHFHFPILPFSSIPIIFSFSFCLKIRGYKLCLMLLVLLFCRTLGCLLSWFCTLVVGTAHQVLDESPKLVPKCLGLLLHLPDPPGPRTLHPGPLLSRGSSCWRLNFQSKMTSKILKLLNGRLKNSNSED